MKGTRTARTARAAQWTIIGALGCWTLLAHTVLIELTGFSAWRLGGFGMYGEPGQRMTAVAVVACVDDPTCRTARSGGSALAEEAVPGLTVAVFDARDTEIDHVRDARAGSDKTASHAIALMLIFPTSSYAERIVDRLVPECSARRCMVFHYRQRTSLVHGRATIEERSFVVDRMKPGR